MSLLLIVVVALAPGIRVDIISSSVGTMHDCVQSTGGELIPHVESKANATRMELKPSILQRQEIIFYPPGSNEPSLLCWKDNEVGRLCF